MNRPIIRIYTGNGEFIDREMNDDEFAQYEIDKADAQLRQAEAEAKAQAKAAAQAKLAALGLTVSDLEALGL
jgi:multidrug resistance efflux pump